MRDKQVFLRDDGTEIYLELFNTREWCKNIFQVTHQTTVEGKYKNRYDVTLLINGLPVVQIELKCRGLDFKEAFNQIQRYRRHSFRGLYRYLQLFVVSGEKVVCLLIGKIVRVPLMSIWKRVVYDFTSWQQENINNLNDALGIEFNTPEREQSAGSFNVYLLAEVVVS